MRLFQNSGVPPSLLSRQGQGATFKVQIARFLEQRYGALHFLAPVLNGEDTAFFTNGDDEVLQRTWAREMGMSRKAGLADVLLAQIESHRTEVFYNLDPIRYGSDFVRRLPGCVRKAVAWRNIPTPYSGLRGLRRYPVQLAYSSEEIPRLRLESRLFLACPRSHNEPICREERPPNRFAIRWRLFATPYEARGRTGSCRLSQEAYRVEFCLARSRFTRLAESPLGYLAPVSKYRRPNHIRAVSSDPIYGRDLYSRISKAKIVLNGAIDMLGDDRGNMRCFESMGCRALLLSDEGVYPAGMVGGQTLVTYRSPANLVVKLRELLQVPEVMMGIAQAGHEMVCRGSRKASSVECF